MSRLRGSHVDFSDVRVNGFLPVRPPLNHTTYGPDYPCASVRKRGFLFCQRFDENAGEKQ